MKTILKKNQEWQTVELGEICGISTGTGNSIDAIENGKCPFFDRSMVTKYSDQFIFDKEAVIVPGEGQEFTPRYYSGKFHLHQRAYAVFNSSKNIEMKYLYFYMKIMNKKYFPSVAVGSTVKSLRLPHFQQYKIPLPPLKVQGEIVGMVAPFDEKIAALRGQNVALQKIADAIYTEWKQTGRLNGWKAVKLGDEKFFSIDYGTRVVQGRTNRGNYDVYGGGGKTFTIDTFNREDCTIVSRFAISKKCVRRIAGKFFLNDSGLSVKVADAKSVSQNFLDYVLLKKQEDIYATGTGAAQRNLMMDEFKKIKIPLPPLKEQEQIATLIEGISANEREIVALEKVRDILLKQIMKEVMANARM